MDLQVRTPPGPLRINSDSHGAGPLKIVMRSTKETLWSLLRQVLCIPPNQGPPKRFLLVTFCGLPSNGHRPWTKHEHHRSNHRQLQHANRPEPIASASNVGAEPQLAADQRGDGCAGTDHAVERFRQDRRPDRLPVV